MSAPITFKISDIDQPAQAQPVSFHISQAQPVQESGLAHATIKAAPKPLSKDWWLEKMYNAIDATTQALPAAAATAGGMIGSTVGLEGTVGGAGIGGMGGEALKQIIRRGLGYEDAPKTTGEAAKRITEQGAIQGGIQGLSEGVGALAGPLQSAATGQYERALAATTAKNKVIARRITPEMMDRGVTGSLDSMADQAAANAAKLKAPLDQAYAAMPVSATKGSGATIISDLENLKSKYMVAGKVARPEAVDAISRVQDVVRQYGDDISPDSLRKLKAIFDDPAARAGAYAGGDIGGKYAILAEKQAANSARNILHSASPDVAALDKEMSFWLDVKKVTKASAIRRISQEGGLQKVIAPVAAGLGGGTGFAAGGLHGGLEGAIGAGGAAALAQAMRSTQWRTVSAVIKNRLADAMARGSAGEVLALLSRAGFAVGGAAMSGQQIQQPNQP